VGRGRFDPQDRDDQTTLTGQLGPESANGGLKQLLRRPATTHRVFGIDVR